MKEVFAYYQTCPFTAKLAGQTVQFISKPGLPAWDRVSPSATLLAQVVQPHPADRLMLLGCGHGALAAVLARQVTQGQVWATDNLATATAMTRQTLAANQVSNAYVFSTPGLPAPETEFDKLIMLLPKGRKLARRWLLQAYAALAPGGEFYLAGANDEGIQAVLKDASELFGEAGILGYKKGNRAARMLKPTTPRPIPPWASEPGIAPGSWYTFEAAVRGQVFKLHSLAGVFSYDQLDEGTALLLETLSIPQQASVLDIGCGYGILGLYASRMGAANVDLLDNNLLAVACAQENIALNQAAGAQVLAGDLLAPVHDRQYDLVLSNPPFHTGKEVDYQVAHTLIAHAYQVLRTGGQLILVANRFIRYDRLMQQIFGHAILVQETGRFHVLAGQK
jgi:16S rRNA (guanine1207-N2)-methyltransferase